MHDKILEEVKEDLHELKEESKLLRIVKKIILILISFFLLLLILSYMLPSYNLFSIISSRFNSFEMNDNVIDLGNEQIVFQGNSYDDLLEIYNENQQHEFKACLIGNKEGNVYRIESVEMPIVISQDFSSVTAEPCSKYTIISLHSHPYKSCYFSVHDVNVYRMVKNINPDALMGIMCEPNRFNFYGFD